MKPITLPILMACGFSREAEKYLMWLNALLPFYGITTLKRLAHFLGQVCVESDRGRAEQEYASGAAYEGRGDLGNTQKGDGVRFKGRGGIQCTGRTNYTAFANKFDIDAVNHPELLEQPKWWVASALWYWDTHRLNNLADSSDVLGISQTVNQGSKAKPGSKRKLPNNYTERVKYTNQALVALAPLFEPQPQPQTA